MTLPLVARAVLVVLALGVLSATLHTPRARANSSTSSALASAGARDVGPARAANGLGEAAGAFATPVALARLKLSSRMLDVPQAVPARAARLEVPPRLSWVLEDARAFWLTAGTGALLVNLGSHILLGGPTLVAAAVLASAISAAMPVLGMPVFLGVVGAYVVLQAAGAALVTTAVFNAASRFYQADWAAAFAGHLVGTVVAAGIAAVPFTLGGFLMGSVGGLASFTGGAGVNGLAVLSALGALPAAVAGAVILIALPAFMSTAAMTRSAAAKPGYAVQPLSIAPPGAPQSALAPALPLLALAVPGT